MPVYKYKCRLWNQAVAAFSVYEQCEGTDPQNIYFPPHFTVHASCCFSIVGHSPWKGWVFVVLWAEDLHFLPILEKPEHVKYLNN